MKRILLVCVILISAALSLAGCGGLWNEKEKVVAGPDAIIGKWWTAGSYEETGKYVSLYYVVKVDNQYKVQRIYQDEKDMWPWEEIVTYEAKEKDTFAVKTSVPLEGSRRGLITGVTVPAKESLVYDRKADTLIWHGEGTQSIVYKRFSDNNRKELIQFSEKMKEKYRPTKSIEIWLSK